MGPGILKKPVGGSSYARLVTILLLALGVAAAVFMHAFHKRAADTKGGAGEPFRRPMEVEQDLMRGLAKSKNRFFTDEQVSLLKRELKKQKGESVAIECPMGDLKACYLAIEINLIFEASGWIVGEFLFAAQPTPGESLIIRVKDESLMAGAEDLAQLFRSAGLSVTTQLAGEQLFDLKIFVPTEGPQA